MSTTNRPAAGQIDLFTAPKSDSVTFAITTHGEPDGQGRTQYTIEWDLASPETFLHHGREITITKRAQVQRANVDETVRRLIGRGNAVVVDGQAVSL